MVNEKALFVSLSTIEILKLLCGACPDSSVNALENS